MKPRGFLTVTLGCKLNRFDSAAIEGELMRRGLRPVTDPREAAVVVVNTCTVTHRADADARKLVRSMRRANDRCTLLVTGCYAERAPRELAALAGVDRIFGNFDKPRLPEILDELGVEDAGFRDDRGCDGAVDPLHFGDRSRAFLRVQEGCRLACSYCIIPRVRGASRSVPRDGVIASAAELAAAGYREIVLTGVNTGDWGRDLAPRRRLVQLLEALLAACPTTRFRLNSLEPLTVEDELVALMAAEPRLAPHLQIPLQAGCDATLQAMRRNYRRQAWLDRLRRLREAIPHVGLGADVIVGFPGESEARFEESLAFVADSPLNYLHVFSWSPRPGTPAVGLPERVAPDRIKLRSRRMRALGTELDLRFRRSLVGRTLEAVVLGPRPDDPRPRALTGNFVEVLLPPESCSRREPVTVRLERADRDDSYAVVVGRPPWALASP